MKKLCLLLLFLAPLLIAAQVTYPVNGTTEKNYENVVYTNATIYISSQKIIQNGSIHVLKGKINAIHESIVTVPGAIVIDLHGGTVYPSFIDLYSSHGLPAAQKQNNSKTPQYITDKTGAFSWNEAVHPEYDAASEFKPESKPSENMCKMGFGLALSHRADGIFRGTGALVNTSQSEEVFALEVPYAATFYSFYKGSSSQDYPNSQMGAIALMRQTFYDARWYAGQSEEQNLSLEAQIKSAKLPKIFEAKDPLELFRIYKIAVEFDMHFIVRITGHEYRWAEDLAYCKDRLKLIVPLDFDKAPRQDNPLLSDMISTTQLYDFFYSPYTAKFLADQGFEYCLTSDGLKKPEDFFKAIRTLHKTGLTRDQIIQALTITPATFIGKEQFGRITLGSPAHFFVMDGDLFDKDSRIIGTVIKDRWIETGGLLNPKMLGKLQIQHQGRSVELVIQRPLDKPKVSTTGKDKTTFIKVEHYNSLLISIDNVHYQILYPGETLKVNKGNDVYTLNYLRIVSIDGVLDAPVQSYQDTAKKEPEKLLTIPFEYQMEYAYANRDSNSYALTNVTIWTCEEEGIIEKGTVLVINGKISRLGLNVKVPNGLKVIDGTGMHLTPGLIDEHSHIAIFRGVNEGTQAVTAEVRIGDVLNSQDINIYRQLAGGVTTSHLLHGSANPIGGQTELIKLRYGMAPEDLKFDEGFKFIKFALGENVKQTNWGDHQTVRYPQTRMGVEQVYIDAFTRARAYQMLPEANKRIDLELEALSEIMNAERFITCHSYQQGEINMLMHVADSFHFKVNTFTHVLEGYKLADKLAAHGAAASTFADWWAYKYEVIDAIPYNAALLTQMGVLTGINSDDAEMGRRLNHEAAKAMKYGGLTEIQALNLITINPARMLHIDNRVGSIAIGKDADLVLWTGHPLSVYSQVYMTFVDGVIYYSMNQNSLAFMEIQRRRSIMLNTAAEQKQEAEPKPENNKLYHCDDNEDETH